MLAEIAAVPHEIQFEAVDVVVVALLCHQREDPIAHLGHGPVQDALVPAGSLLRANAPLRMLGIKLADGMNPERVARYVHVLKEVAVVHSHRDERRLAGLAASVNEHLQEVAAAENELVHGGDIQGIVPRIRLEVLLPPAHVLGHRGYLALVPRHWPVPVE